jgi:hypothetical protein
MFGEATRTVPIERALALLDSPATHYLGPEWFRAKRIPFALHEALGGKHTQITGPDAQYIRRVHIHVTWPDGEVRTDPEVMVFDRQGRALTQQLGAPGLDGARTLIVFRDTWLGVLKACCAPLCGDLLWSEAEAVAFVMSGQRPEIRPVSAEWAVARDNAGKPIRTEVTVRLQPFVSIDSVDHMLATVRVMIGRRLRPGPAMAYRTLALFEFVEEARARAEWEAPPWTELVSAWDIEHRRKGWGYGGDRRNFRRDYERARHLLLEDYLPARERLDVHTTPELSKRVPMKKTSS